MKHDSLLGILAGLAATAIWGGMYVVSKVVMAVIPPFSLIVLRLALGILTLGIIALIRKNWRVTAGQFWSIFAVGLVGYGISLGFQFVGTDLSTAANGSLVTSATPAFVLLFAAILLKEKITSRRLIALLVATLGVLAVIDPRSAQLSSRLFWGNLSLVAAALTWALYSVLVRRLTREVDVLSTSLIAFAGGLPVCLPLGAWEAATRGYGAISPGVVAGVLFVGVISTALAMFLWNTAFARLEASLASLTFFAQPVVGTLLGVIFLGEQITSLFLAGGFLIGIGLLIASKD
ncbi:MAG: DMT family transporter [Anaerolineales bacterium]|nr:DMT family transporter [Anaerolineales bacterium]